jgi:hypothetical protein
VGIISYVKKLSVFIMVIIMRFILLGLLLISFNAVASKQYRCIDRDTGKAIYSKLPCQKCTVEGKRIYSVQPCLKPGQQNDPADQVANFERRAAKNALKVIEKKEIIRSPKEVTRQEILQSIKDDAANNERAPHPDYYWDGAKLIKRGYDIGR